jgi:threonine dehydratase
VSVPNLPTYADVKAAADRIAGHANKTPMLRSQRLDEDTGRICFIKPEVLQVTGSFKFRGASNRLLQLSEAEKKSGVVAWSSGNHAQGVAAAAKLVGVKATIVMPADAPKLKIENTRRLGAEVVLFDRQTESREEIAMALSAKTGATVVPSYDDKHIIAGQGTAALELAQQVSDASAHMDALLICCGGGGLTAGCSLAMEKASPETKIYSVEPEGYDDHALSFASGKREAVDVGTHSICDALLTPTPGEITFAINQRLVTGGLVVTEAEVRTAMAYAFEVLKLTVEPGGAVALAAVLTGKVPPQHKRIGIVLSGGNVDPDFFAEVLKGRHTTA